MVNKFDDIRPFFDEEIHDAMIWLSENKDLPIVLSYVFPDVDVDEIKKNILEVKTTKDMQNKIMLPIIEKIIKMTVKELIFEGKDNINPKNTYTYISNHRDIVLDNAIFQYLLLINNIDTTAVLFGDNLLKTKLMRIVAKTNKLFVAYRGNNVKEFFIQSKLVSEYIRLEVTEKQQSVWLAQGNGRTKDGNDKTEPGLIKMLNMSGTKDFFKDISELNITPFSVSYQLEPCDFLKTYEVYQTRRTEYVKHEKEDQNSIITGIKEYKEGVCFNVCETLTEEEILKAAKEKNNNRNRVLAQIIDDKIHKSFKLWDTNYIAYDMLNNTEIFTKYYTKDRKNFFIDYMNKGLSEFKSMNMAELKDIFLNIYANPVKNKINR